MKGVEVYAIDRKVNPHFSNERLDGTVVETNGDFRLVDPVGPMFKFEQPAYDAVATSYFKPHSISVDFDDFESLVAKLEKFEGFKTEGFQGKFEKGSIRLLAFITHGNKGVVFLNGLEYPNGIDQEGESGSYLAHGRMDEFKPQLTRLGYFLAPDGAVRFDACNSGANQEGTDLLIDLSDMWPGVKVVGYADFAVNANANGKISGVLDSSELDEEPTGWKAKRLKWTSPPRSEHSPYAKIAQDGVIIQWPSSEALDPQDIPPYLLKTDPLGNQVFKEPLGLDLLN